MQIKPIEFASVMNTYANLGDKSSNFWEILYFLFYAVLFRKKGDIPSRRALEKKSST